MNKCPFSDPAMIWQDFATVREAPGLTWSATMQKWIVSRYEDVVQVLHDPETYSSLPTVPEMPAELKQLLDAKVPDRGTLIGHDNPTHDRLRGAVNSFFMPRRLAHYEPWIEAQAHALIDDFHAQGEADLRTRFSSPLPLKVISHIIGLDPSHSDRFYNALQFFTGPSSEKAQPLIELHEHIMQIIEQRRDDRRDDLISHVWNARDSGEAPMTDFEMLSLFPGLMLAGHETSANLIVMALAHLLSEPGRYEAAQRDDASRVQAIEEALRYEAPITGMPRRVTRPTVLCGQMLQTGDELFLAYGSANRDRCHFADGEVFLPDRGASSQHIGFGQGIHACLGAPLARLILKVEMRVIHARLPGLRLAIPYEARQYFPMREVRALVSAPFAWDVLDSHRHKPRAPLPEVPAPLEQWLPSQVVQRRAVAEGVIELAIARPQGASQTWQAGAHISLKLGTDLVRQYSLCGSLEDADLWRIAVKLEQTGRGGSSQIHRLLHPGAALHITAPRSNFRLMPGDGPSLLIAAGIGITPMLPMIEALRYRTAPWRLIYIGRREEEMAYARELKALYPTQVTLWFSARHGRFDLAQTLGRESASTQVYACGPQTLLDSLKPLCAELRLKLTVEHFQPPAHDAGDDQTFDVELASTGQRIAVGKDESILKALAREGIHVLSTCQEGTCGSCEVGIVEGQAVHRDSVLSAEEKSMNQSLMVCVSRCAGGTLRLDL
ncbi:cytochrome P450 [Pseudomonas sp. NPDC089401]|uniref:cytochrome P450/oxidoreductase n=1 Tax=Pseudomonas sp. NPDC089401 TaxID=3364462 RepID=UPI0037FFCAD5